MMNKKDEALKKCLRVLEPIANERMYETQWVDSAIRACHEALEEKEWQGLSKKDDALKCAIQTLKPWHNREIKTLLDFSGAIKVCEEALEEKEWQGLSDEEIEEVYKKVSESLGKKTIYEIHTYAKAIEQKLKEKNHDTT